MRVELSLPDEVYYRAQQLAQVSHRSATSGTLDTEATVSDRAFAESSSPSGSSSARVAKALIGVSHGSISETVRARLREQARERCGYCLSAQQYVLGPRRLRHDVRHFIL